MRLDRLRALTWAFPGKRAQGTGKGTCSWNCVAIWGSLGQTGDVHLCLAGFQGTNGSNLN